MKVGFFSHTPLEYYGGGEVTVIMLANWFASTGREVDIRIADGFNGPRRLSPQAIRDQLDPRVSYGTIPFLDRRASGYPFLFASKMPDFDQLAAHDANLILLPTVPDRPYLAEVSRRQLPVMFLLHSLTLDRQFPIRRKILFNQLLHRSTLYVLRGLPPSPRLLYEILNDRSAQMLERHGVDPRQVLLIPTGIDFASYSVREDGGTFRVVFLGRLEEPWKGIRLLRDVIDRVLAGSREDLEVLVLGSGPDENLLRAWASQRPRVTCRGFVSSAEKTGLLATAGVILSTSGAEPYGLSSIEGLASGLPLVATPTAGSEYILAQDPSFGHRSTYSADGLAQGVLRYYTAWASDRARYFRDREARRARARELFDLPVMFTRYAESLQMLAGNGAAKARSPS
jgi:glycosyltransferase involved in cell wall biosynthesis